MKNFIRIACILICLFSQTHLFANTVIVKGTVKDSANNPVANRTVKIYSTDSTNNGCILSHTKVTNANGYYIDTLTCNGDIRKLAIIVENCDGVKITHDPSVSSTNIVESNFVICTPINTAGAVPCKAAFSYTSLTTGVKFNSAGSAGIFAADSIISRSWTFGDSSATLTGNIVDPTHAYTKPGVYNVCLTIKTKYGCENKYCSTVVFTPASNDCNVQAMFSTEKIGNKIFRFNSSNSTTLTGDSIVQRIWKFGDGFSLDGNQVNPSREYKDSGNYTVCLSVRTAKGCEKQYCFNLSVRDTSARSTNCKAAFTYSAQGTTVKFSAAGSAAAAGDSIISRIWIFGDNTTPSTVSSMDPTHAFAKAGTYNVCLYIKTKGGCESNSCQNVTVRDSATVPTNCKAVFTYTIKDSVIVFNSADSKGATASDSIISRTWYYADSTTSVSLPGNIITPSYPYTKPGTYNVYLVIKTQSGCESKYSGKVVIAPKPAATNCKAYFSFAVQNKIVKFNSITSAASSVQDSIISRIWFFGDSTNSNAGLSGNIVDPTHEYKKAGTYHVYLYIKTRSGCESKYEATVVIAAPNCEVKVQYSTERVSLRNIRFNSSLNTTAAGDSIVARNWKFGDNTTLGGNEINPLKEYSLMGFYNTCLQVKTANGCEAQVCKEITIQDTITTPQTNVDYIKIISINPNPVITRMMATIFSRNSNVEAEISIYDIYGNGKMNIKKLLSQGNNVIEIATDFLPHGPYFLKVSTKNGRDSKTFYKL